MAQSLATKLDISARQVVELLSGELRSCVAKEVMILDLRTQGAIPADDGQASHLYFVRLRMGGLRKKWFSDEELATLLGELHQTGYVILAGESKDLLVSTRISINSRKLYQSPLQ